MSLYQYSKSKPKKRSTFFGREGLAFIFSVLGIFLVGNAVAPIVNYQMRYAGRFGKILSPLVYDSGSVLGKLSAQAQEDERDYTLISSWFTEEKAPKSGGLPPKMEISHYFISIPKLRIKDAIVRVGGEDLKKNLIHYPTTAFPGEPGNAVVFGHSVLPQFFNPENYLTIFSTLYKLKEGDEVNVGFDGINYRYLVEDLYEVTAEDLSVLEQRYDDRFLTLITCSPPGTYLRRLVVKARLVE